MNVEVTRARYRPDRITTLFIGEAAPAREAFFYYGNSALTRHMETALEPFKAYGWYLNDLVLTPVDHLQKPERAAQCTAAMK